ncbi:MAG TPA: DUF4153 domain-containing protein [Pseudomonas sp.]|nr:DUF4153 domain-containing protein [Pseudomonas sp.]
MSWLSRTLSVYLAIGLGQGLLFWWILGLESPGLSAAVATVALVGGINLQLLGGGLRSRGAVLLAAGLALGMASISAWVFWPPELSEKGAPSSDWLKVSWGVGSVVLAYIATAFILSWPTREKHRLRYEDLFRHAWNNVFILLLAALLTGVFWLLLMLWGSLFRMLGIEQFAQWFSAPGFVCLSTALVFSLGVRMGRDNERVIGLLRGILLTLCRFLLPLSALIAVLFSLALPFTGLSPIWSTGFSTPILIGLVGINLFLLNGVFQDGRQGDAYPSGLRRLVELCLLCLPVLMALAGYSTYLRIEQHGLSPSRFLAALLVLVGTLHSLAALWAVVRRQPLWLGSLCASNPLIALLLCVLLVGVHSPWLSPLEFSARNQVQRLLSGRTAAEDFDAEYLRYSLGAPGLRQFEALQGLLEQGRVLEAPARERLQALMREASHGGADSLGEAVEPPGPKLEWLGTPEEGHEQFVALASDSFRCQNPGCLLWAVDLDLAPDGRKEVLQLSKEEWPTAIFFFTRSDAGEWRQAGTLEGTVSTPELIRQIRAGAAWLVRPRYQSLQAEGVLLVPLPREPEAARD